MAQLPSLEHDTDLTAASSPVLSAARPDTGIAVFQVPEAPADVERTPIPVASTPTSATITTVERNDGQRRRVTNHRIVGHFDVITARNHHMIRTARSDTPGRSHYHQRI